jgi:hypothetical protein
MSGAKKFPEGASHSADVSREQSSSIVTPSVVRFDFVKFVAFAAKSGWKKSVLLKEIGGV